MQTQKSLQTYMLFLTGKVKNCSKQKKFGVSVENCFKECIEHAGKLWEASIEHAKILRKKCQNEFMKIAPMHCIS